MGYLRRNIERLEAYTPGEQPPPGSRVVKLNTNENCYPPSPKVLRSLKSFRGESLRRYPDPMSRALCERAAKLYGVPANWVLAGNGSDEHLALIVRAYLEPGRKAACPVPTYSLYRTLARMQDAGLVEIPYDDNYGLPVEKLIRAAAVVTFICSPNNPSATVAPVKDLERLASRVKGILVVDEAYTDFADENAMSLVKKFRNVMVLRTVSKGYSLAGLRLGFAVAHPEVLEGLIKIKDSYNVDAVTSRVGIAALSDQAWKDRNARRIIKSRTKLSKNLERLGFRVWPSQANFLLARPADKKAGRLYRALKDRGILVRYWDRPGLSDKVRITVGTEEENGTLLDALKKLIR
ncbi:MAG TPA: histidinol-phosphate transaminase [Syntrophales bacterium]|nr:histidinol-phosphate transaminase [Syntrophales bacterium]HOX95073.1 histidinol-phosphate transaminase [Syntrophales bacterium]HPI55766.1 histidinol-phosphate transaminase [Syntrophales bacterium]HPN23742.1 histidinol-phosphate transaminase [Syntrophales bacterium]HQM27732.1 histidinol-phosphate transaminase [Syntrophales bacterium]